MDASAPHPLPTRFIFLREAVASSIFATFAALLFYLSWFLVGVGGRWCSVFYPDGNERLSCFFNTGTVLTPPLWIVPQVHLPVLLNATVAIGATIGAVLTARANKASGSIFLSIACGFTLLSIFEFLPIIIQLPFLLSISPQVASVVVVLATGIGAAMGYRMPSWVRRVKPEDGEQQAQQALWSERPSMAACYIVGFSSAFILIYLIRTTSVLSNLFYHEVFNFVFTVSLYHALMAMSPIPAAATGMYLTRILIGQSRGHVHVGRLLLGATVFVLPVAGLVFVAFWVLLTFFPDLITGFDGIDNSIRIEWTTSLLVSLAAIIGAMKWGYVSMTSSSPMKTETSPL